VASSKMRSLVMISLVPEDRLTATEGPSLTCQLVDERLIIRPDCGGLQMVGCYLFHWRKGLHSLRVQERHSSGSRVGRGIGGAGAVGPAYR
jgi:hypothetical protein